jgi:hypothetical protein
MFGKSIEAVVLRHAFERNLDGLALEAHLRASVTCSGRAHRLVLKPPRAKRRASG